MPHEPSRLERTRTDSLSASQAMGDDESSINVKWAGESNRRECGSNPAEYIIERLNDLVTTRFLPSAVALKLFVQKPAQLVRREGVGVTSRSGLLRRTCHKLQLASWMAGSPPTNIILPSGSHAMSWSPSSMTLGSRTASPFSTALDFSVLSSVNSS